MRPSNVASELVPPALSGCTSLEDPRNITPLGSAMAWLSREDQLEEFRRRLCVQSWKLLGPSKTVKRPSKTVKRPSKDCQKTVKRPSKTVKNCQRPFFIFPFLGPNKLTLGPDDLFGQTKRRCLATFDFCEIYFTSDRLKKKKKH